MIRATLHNEDTGQGYARTFTSDAELNQWLMYIQAPEPTTSPLNPVAGCPRRLADGSCGCRLIVRVEEA